MQSIAWIGQSQLTGLSKSKADKFPMMSRVTRYPIYAAAAMQTQSFKSPHLYTHFPTSHSAFELILTSSRLTSLQLIQIPATDRQIALILIHTALEVHHLALADFGGLVSLIHRVLAVLLLSDGLVDGCFGLGAAATEPAADCVADGGADCDATVEEESIEG